MRNTTPSNSRRPGRGRGNQAGRSTRRSGSSRAQSAMEQYPAQSSDREFTRGLRENKDPSRPAVGTQNSQPNQAPRAQEQYSRAHRPQAVPRGDSSSATRQRRGANAQRDSQKSSSGAAVTGRLRRLASLGGKRAQGQKPKQAQQPGGSFQTRLRKFLPMVAISYGAAVAGVIAVAFVVLLSLDISFVAAPATIASFWLVANLAPVSFSGVTLGIVPLLPALGLASWVAFRVRGAVRERVSVSDVRMLVGCCLAVPLLLTLTSLAMIWDAEPVLPVDVPSVWLALAKTISLNGFAVIVGLGPRLWKALLRFRGLPLWLVDGSRIAFNFVASMSIVGLIVVVASMAVHAHEVGQAYAITSGVGGKIGLTLLWLLYLPTASVAAGSVLSGSEMHVGPAAVSLFSATQAELPPLPVLAAMPSDVVSGAWAALLIPAAVAILVYRRFTERNSVIVSPYATVGWAAIVAALLGVWASWMFGGQLGVYGWSGMLWSLTGVVFLAWVGVVGVITMAVIGFNRGQRGRLNSSNSGAAENTPDDDAPEADAQEHAAASSYRAARFTSREDADDDDASSVEGEDSSPADVEAGADSVDATDTESTEVSESSEGSDYGAADAAENADAEVSASSVDSESTELATDSAARDSESDHTGSDHSDYDHTEVWVPGTGQTVETDHAASTADTSADDSETASNNDGAASEEPEEPENTENTEDAEDSEEK